MPAKKEKTRNDVVGLEHKQPHEIAETVKRLEEEANCVPAEASSGR